MKIDIFCKVIDNYGDIGVCWRLCTQLAARGQHVRLIVDDASALEWMVQAQRFDALRTELVQVLTWHQAQGIEIIADLVIESFGCDLPSAYREKMVNQAMLGEAFAWVNLEYLTAQPYAQACHLLPSPVMLGVGAGLVKTFFYPGFTNQTGGLLCEPDLFERQAKFDKAAWFKGQKIAWTNEQVISLFCYEPTALPALLAELQSSHQPTLLLVTAGRSSHAVQAALQKSINTAKPACGHITEALRLHYLPHLTQEDYDHLLWASDFNFVRGEDSLVRAIWAGKPFVWQIYPQADQAHHAKLEAFLDMYLEGAQALTAAQIRAAYRTWNALMDSQNQPADRILLGLHEWKTASLARRALWTRLPDLAGALLSMAKERLN